MSGRSGYEASPAVRREGGLEDGMGSGGGEGVTRLAAGGGGKGGSVLLLRLHFSTCQWSSQQFITLSDFSRSCVGYIHGESQLICIILTSKREDRLSVTYSVSIREDYCKTLLA